MAFSDVSDAVWLAFFGVCSLLIKEYFDRARAQLLTKQVGVIETATDGMKHELVTLTAKSAKQEGVKEGEANLAEVAAKAAHAEGVIEGQKIATADDDKVVQTDPVPVRLVKPDITPSRGP